MCKYPEYIVHFQHVTWIASEGNNLSVKKYRISIVDVPVDTYILDIRKHKSGDLWKLYKNKEEEC